MTHGIPMILDTDIGGDIDDTWALAMLLKSPELDQEPDDGYTLLDRSAKLIRCATAWRDLPSFEESLITRYSARRSSASSRQ